MISKADVIERLGTVEGKELTSTVLHEAIFCEPKHQKILRRFHVGTHTYVNYTVDESDPARPYVDVTIPGNPNTFRVGLTKSDNGTFVFLNEPRIKFQYL